MYVTTSQCQCLIYTHVQEGFTALFTASMEGHTEVVDLLIKAGADIHQATTKVSLYENVSECKIIIRTYVDSLAGLHCFPLSLSPQLLLSIINKYMYHGKEVVAN